MGKTDRSPLQGQKVERDPRVRRTLLTEITKRFRLPKFSAKHAAVAASAITVCIAVVTVAILGGRNTPVQAADIYIGTEEAIPADGAGRYSDSSGKELSDTTDNEETSTNAENPSPEKDDATANDGTKRYTVTFEFHDRDSISCSAVDSATVGEFARRLGITFEESDVLSVSEDTVISSDTVITTDSVTYDTVSVTKAIAFQTKYVDNSSMYKGNTKVSQKGINGESVTVYEVKYVNGVEVSRTQTSSYVSKKPVDKIIQRGTKVYTPSSTGVTQNGSATGGTFTAPNGKTYRYAKYIDVKAVWYPTGGGTYIGLPADENIIAVDPNVIPLGSKVYITGDYADIGVRTAADIGTAIKGNIIDICFDRTNPLAANFGARPMRVYILE